MSVSFSLVSISFSLAVSCSAFASEVDDCVLVADCCCRCRCLPPGTYLAKYTTTTTVIENRFNYSHNFTQTNKQHVRISLRKSSTACTAQRPSDNAASSGDDIDRTLISTRAPSLPSPSSMVMMCQRCSTAVAKIAEMTAISLRTLAQTARPSVYEKKKKKCQSTSTITYSQENNTRIT